MGRFKTQKVRNVPRWATVCFVNDDYSGLGKDDVELIKNFKDKLYKEGLRLICPIDGTDNEFCSCPAFGLACDTVDWTAEVLPKTYELEYRETFVRVVRVKAHSRREAIARCNDMDMLKDGRYGWNSIGERLHRCKEIR